MIGWFRNMLRKERIIQYYHYTYYRVSLLVYCSVGEGRSRFTVATADDEKHTGIRSVVMTMIPLLLLFSLMLHREATTNRMVVAFTIPVVIQRAQHHRRKHPPAWTRRAQVQNG